MVQALVTIKDDDSYGTIELGRTEYSFNENGKEARIFVIRKGGFVGTQELSFSTVDLTAVSSGEMPDYGAISGTLTLEAGQSGSSFVISLFINQTSYFKSRTFCTAFCCSVSARIRYIPLDCPEAFQIIL